MRTSSTAASIQTVAFQTYVENVLPNEWISSWDADALGAGAVAVKSYAWYWVTHYGGYQGATATAASCFDVTDDTDFQVYKANTATARTTAAVLATWPVAARVGGRILQASYRAYLSKTTEACGAAASGTTLSQWGTQNCNEASSGYKYNVILGKYYFPGLQLATARQLRTAHDFQFLQRSTRVMFRAGHWTIDDGYPTTFSYGLSGDRPVITNNGDGFAHIGVFRPSNATWYLAGPTGRTEHAVHFGTGSDIAVQAQYAGVQKPTVLAVFRPSTGTWYQADSTGGIAARISYGVRGDIPVPGHYAGNAANDYADTVAVFRPSDGRWYIRGHGSVQFGAKGDIPMPADYDGNGTTDLAVYRPSNHAFYLRGHAAIVFGVTGDVPVTGDFTGDGRIDLAVYRPSTHTWYVWGGSTFAFGAAGDTPIGTGPTTTDRQRTVAGCGRGAAWRPRPPPAARLSRPRRRRPGAAPTRRGGTCEQYRAKPSHALGDHDGQQRGRPGRCRGGGRADPATPAAATTINPVNSMAPSACSSAIARHRQADPVHARRSPPCGPLPVTTVPSKR